MKKTYKGPLALGLALTVLSGCQIEAGDGLQKKAEIAVSSVHTAGPGQLAGKPEAAAPALTLERIQATFTGGALTPAQAEAAFGSPQTKREDYVEWQGQMQQAELQLFGAKADKGELSVYWSKTGELLHAVYKYQDAAGKPQSYLPAIGNVAGSSSADNRIAKAAGITLDKPVTLYRNTNAYEWMGGQQSVKRLTVDKAVKYKAVTLSADFAEIQEESGAGGWVPVWYLTPEAAATREISPVAVTASPNAKISWYPEATGTAVKLEQDEILYAYEEYKDWYGVIVPDKGTATRTTGLLWIAKRDTTPSSAIPVRYDNGKDNATAADRALAMPAFTRSLLVPGVKQSRIEALLGKPTYVESSGNVGEYDQPVSTLPLWRYEDGMSELMIAWTKEGLLQSVSYRNANGVTLPLSQGVSSSPLVPSEKLSWAWRFKSQLAYNFLLEQVGNVLLVAAEDGGFSGMHMDSKLYALDAASGRQIWKVDLGVNMHHYGLSADKSKMAFVKERYENDKQVDTLYVLETATGRKLWEKRLTPGQAITSLSTSGNTVNTVQYQRISDTEEKFDYYLTGWSMSTGKQLFRHKRTEPLNLMRETGNQKRLIGSPDNGTEPLLLRKLEAYDPQTGKLAWQLPGQEAAYEPYVSDPSRYAERFGAVWTKSFDQLFLTDAASGGKRLELPLPANSGYTIIDRNYAFMQQAANERRELAGYKSKLIDLRTGLTLLEVDGIADFGLVTQNRLDFKLNGKPMAFDLTAKRLLWAYNGELSLGLIAGPSVWFQGKLLSAHPIDQQLYRLNAATGNPEARIAGVQVGYYDFTPNRLLHGYLSVSNGRLYVGSANGYFSQVK